MKKLSLILLVPSIMASVASGATMATLDLPADGNYAAPTTITTSQTAANGATFDIVYTVSAVSNDTGAVVGVITQLLGVGSDNDINPNHFNSLEGSGSAGANGSTAGGEGLSFTGLAITNFQANGSGTTAANITDLQFEGLTLSSVANANDGVNVSFTGYGLATANQNLNAANTGGNPYTLDLTALANYSSTADDLYIQPDTGQGNNRWNVSGLSVSYVPEPSSSALLGLGFAGLLLRRGRA